MEKQNFKYEPKHLREEFEEKMNYKVQDADLLIYIQWLEEKVLASMNEEIQDVDKINADIQEVVRKQKEELGDECNCGCEDGC